MRCRTPCAALWCCCTTCCVPHAAVHTRAVHARVQGRAAPFVAARIAATDPYLSCELVCRVTAAAHVDIGSDGRSAAESAHTPPHSCNLLLHSIIDRGFISLHSIIETAKRQKFQHGLSCGLTRLLNGFGISSPRAFWQNCSQPQRATGSPLFLGLSVFWVAWEIVWVIWLRDERHMGSLAASRWCTVAVHWSLYVSMYRMYMHARASTPALGCFHTRSVAE